MDVGGTTCKGWNIATAAQFLYEPQQEVMLEYQHKNRYVMQTLINYCIETISVVGYGYDFEQKALQLLKEVHGDEINV